MMSFEKPSDCLVSLAIRGKQTAQKGITKDNEKTPDLRKSRGRLTGSHPSLVPSRTTFFYKNVIVTKSNLARTPRIFGDESPGPSSQQLLLGD